jgi:hypothetical protein
MATFFDDPNALPLLELSTRQFRYIAEDRLLVADASALCLPGKPFTWWLQQLFRDDLFIRGICLRSHRTGTVLRFVEVYREVRHGWTAAWVFDSIEGPSLSVCILNDSVPIFEGVRVRDL